MKNTKLLHPLFFFTAVCLSVATLTATRAQDGHEDPRDTSWDLNVDPSRVLGVESCEKCHAAEIQTWKATPHHDTFLTLHRKKEAQQIASKLGISSFKTDSNCVQCHYTMKQVGGLPVSTNGSSFNADLSHAVEAISGVSCESCHGPAKDWLTVHNDYGGPGVTRASESKEHRRSRLSDSIKSGMRNPVNLYLVAQSCYRCHTVPDEELVNIGGHNAGSLDFEIVSWSQGLVRHNFVRADGQHNAENTPERLRVMFIAGMIADLEFSMRATASATEKATFGVTSAKRTARAAARLKSAQSKLNQPILQEVLDVFASVELKLNNRDQLTDAAEQIHKLGLRFAATVSGAALSAINDYIPSKDKWK
jgi:hypothetical protein